jgi:glycosyltransferase involved in cell wall biosynthesis
MRGLAVVIPCFRVRAHILGVLAGIGPEVSDIIVVDDACPEGSGELVRSRCRDRRVQVLTHSHNQGVGGATLTGIQHVLACGAEIIIKLDGDGQMDPALIPDLVRPIALGLADACKGNRFARAHGLDRMPLARLAGNAALSLCAKAMSGYWQILDPTNGFIALSALVARRLPFAELERRYFFESGLLFHLGLLRAVVRDVPMTARYASETSSLSVSRAALEFPGKYLRRFCLRLWLRYFVRDFTPASLQLVFGMLFFGSGAALALGLVWRALVSGGYLPAAGVATAGLPMVLGLQLLLAAVQLDVASAPKEPLAALEAREPIAERRARLP